MIHEQAPTEKPYEKSEGERRGLIIVNTGDGKGKSTAARARQSCEDFPVHESTHSALWRTPHV